jgi:hypothetical protein
VIKPESWGLHSVSTIIYGVSALSAYSFALGEKSSIQKTIDTKEFWANLSDTASQYTRSSEVEDDCNYCRVLLIRQDWIQVL